MSRLFGRQKIELYTMRYFPPEKALIKVLAKEYSWAKQFVLMRGVWEPKPINDDDKERKAVGSIARPKFEFDDVTLALGDLKMNDGGQINLEYEVVAVPESMAEEFKDIVAGTGKTWKRLKKTIDYMLSGFINAIIQEQKEDDNKSIIILP